MPRPLPAALLLALAASPALAQEPPAGPAIPDHLREQIRRDPAGWLSGALRDLLGVGPDGRLTEAAARLHERLDEAAFRADRLRPYLLFDLDGDLVIQRSEVAELREGLGPGRTAELDRLVTRADRDLDGAISSAELAAYVVETASPPGPGDRDTALTDLLVFDRDANRVVTIEELVQGTLDITAASARADAPTLPCALPAPSATAEVVLLSVLEGAALSPLSLGQPWETTTAVMTGIERGDPPLYVVALSDGPVLWRVEGDRDRVEHLVIGARDGGAGASGLSAERVHFPSADCLPPAFADADGFEAKVAQSILTGRLGREVAAVVAGAAFQGVGLPSGQESMFTPGHDDPLQELESRATFAAGNDPAAVAVAQEAARTLRQSLRRSRPASIIGLRPDTPVVASRSAEPYALLPEEAGVLQLLADRAIQPLEDGRWRIVGPMPRFPPGLVGEHRQDFVLAPGIPMPEGSPGQSGVTDEDTGACLTPRWCRED